MNLNQLIELANEMHDKESATLIGKNYDYANTDALSNFKVVASNMGVNPEMVALTLINVKVTRLNNLIMESKQGKNESIEDTIMDMRNYLTLLNAIRNEK